MATPRDPGRLQGSERIPGRLRPHRGNVRRKGAEAVEDLQDDLTLRDDNDAVSTFAAVSLGGPRMVGCPAGHPLGCPSAAVMARDDRQLPRLKLAIRFGSTVEGRARSDSDVDIAVLAERELTLAEQSEVVAALAQRFQFPEDRIDLVDLQNASPLLQHEVAEKGELLEGDPDDFLHFRVLAWKLYQDTARLRRAREKRVGDVLDVP